MHITKTIFRYKISLERRTDYAVEGQEDYRKVSCVTLTNDEGNTPERLLLLSRLSQFKYSELYADQELSFFFSLNVSQFFKHASFD